jgi:hypothetical protein
MNMFSFFFFQRGRRLLPNFSFSLPFRKFLWHHSMILCTIVYLCLFYTCFVLRAGAAFLCRRRPRLNLLAYNLLLTDHWSEYNNNPCEKTS